MKKESDFEMEDRIVRVDADHFSPKCRLEKKKFYGGGDVEKREATSHQHYLPPELAKHMTFHDDGHVRDVWLTEEGRFFIRKEWKQAFEYEEINGTSKALPLSVKESQGALSGQSAHEPPLNVEYILHLFLSGDERDAVIGDLIEGYGKKCERFGQPRAKLWFYTEVVRSLWPLLGRLLTKASGLIALGEWIRRHVS